MINDIPNIETVLQLVRDENENSKTIFGRYETWRQIQGYEYSFSSFGNVKNNKTGRILQPGDNGLGYLYVILHTNTIKKQMKVHRLVASAFLPNDINKLCVDHIDHCKSNNNVSNLRWASHQENSRNKVKPASNTSGFIGVNFDKRTKKYSAHISIGTFDTPEEASDAYKRIAKELYGEFFNDQ